MEAKEEQRDEERDEGGKQYRRVWREKRKAEMKRVR